MNVWSSHVDFPCAGSIGPMHMAAANSMSSWHHIASAGIHQIHQQTPRSCPFFLVKFPSSASPPAICPPSPPQAMRPSPAAPRIAAPHCPSAVGTACVTFGQGRIVRTAPWTVQATTLTATLEKLPFVVAKTPPCVGTLGVGEGGSGVHKGVHASTGWVELYQVIHDCS